MATITVNINFRNYTRHFQLVADLSVVFSAKQEDIIYFRLDLNTYSLLHGDFLILLVAAIKHLKIKHIRYEVELINFNPLSGNVTYASRINFFRELNIPYPEGFNRHDGAGRFVEICSYNDDETANSLHNRIIEILKASTRVNEPVLMLLEYCLYEILDNVINHASAPTGGWCVVQLFPKMKEIRLMIGDTGIGIHQALTQTPGTEYAHLTPAQALEMSPQKGVTNGRGVGNGLFHTAFFVKENGGELILHSGEYLYRVFDGEAAIQKVNNWQGTYVFLKINTEIDVDYKLVLGKSSTLKENYDFLFGDKEDLW